jgi:hypothetical protein
MLKSSQTFLLGAGIVYTLNVGFCLVSGLVLRQSYKYILVCVGQNRQLLLR